MDQIRIYLLLAWITIVVARPGSENITTQCSSRGHCQALMVTLNNNPLAVHGDLQGIFQLSLTINGRPSWTSTSNAIWYSPNDRTWAIGSLEDVGTSKCGISGIFDNEVDDPQNIIDWQYHRGYGWETPDVNDIIVECIDDEASVDLTRYNPTKANDMVSAIKSNDLRGLYILLAKLNVTNPIITKFGSAPVTVLHHSAALGKLDIFKSVSATVANMQPKVVSGESKGATPLHYAGQQGRMNMVRYITNCLSNINPAADDGRTVMAWAAERGQLEVIKFYLNALEDKNPPQISSDDFNGRTPLHAAAQLGKLEVVKAITAVISDKNPKDSHGITPLHIVSDNGSLEVVKYLCENFVRNVNIQTDSYWNRRTPLHWASQGGHLKIVRYLIKKGADPMIRSYSGKTAYDYAIDTNHTDVSNYLRQFNYV